MDALVYGDWSERLMIMHTTPHDLLAWLSDQARRSKQSCCDTIEGLPAHAHSPFTR